MESTTSGIRKHSKYLIMTLALILMLGVVMVFSSSFLLSKDYYGNPSYLFLKQLSFVVVGSGLAFVVSKTKVTFWLKFGPMIHLFFTFLVLLTFVDGLGSTVKGANRWVNFGFLGIQPGEFIKYTIALVAIPFFEEFDKSTPKQIINRAIIMLLPLLFLLLQPDFGTFSISFFVLLFIGFYSSFNRKYFYISSLVGLVCGGVTLVSQPYRVERLLTFLDPWKNPQGSGFQIIQSYMGFANGALFGKGLGNSHEKLFYLPEAHNDFIFSVIGEELGFVGVLVLVCLYAVLIYHGFRVGLEIDKKWPRLVVLSVTFTIGLQAMLNMGVVLGLLPTKGLNLPFISYGGSSLLSNLFALGILFSAVTSWIKSQSNFDEAVEHSHSQTNAFMFR